jgi:membrane fusion protein
MSKLGPEEPQFQSLFREESLENTKVRSIGSVILVPHLSGWLISLLFSFLAICVLIFLWQGSHTRRVTTTGQIIPAEGLIRVYTPQAGIVMQKHVTDGQLVTKGSLLFVINSDRIVGNSREMHADMATQVSSRQRSLQEQMNRYRLAKKEELESVQQRIENLEEDAVTVASLISQQEQRLQLAEESQRRYQTLLKQDLISGEEALQKQLEASEQRSRLKALQRDALSAQREVVSLHQEKDNIKQRYESQIAQLERDISVTTQELTEIETRRRVLVTATETGRVTLVSAEIGQVVDNSKALATIVPESSRLIARLYAPSSSIGFVQQGDQILIRYQAFPYQKFGQHNGVVKSVSTSSISPADVANILGTSAQTGESYFSIDVELKEFSIKTATVERPLQPGMLLEADILQERRKLYEWIFEPLYGITQRTT